jgi:PleD family two-component response regulator
MENKALVIHDSQNQSFDCNAFMNERNLVPEYYSTGARALFAFRIKRYRCVVVPMDMQYEDPLETIRGLRSIEIELGLPSTKILVVYKTRQPTQREILEFNIGGQIRSNRIP